MLTTRPSRKRSTNRDGVIEERVNGFGISEAEVTVVGADRINAQIPGVDADEASDLVGSTALLEFRSIDPAQPQPQPPLDRLQVGAAIDDVWDTTLQGGGRAGRQPLCSPCRPLLHSPAG